MDTEPLKRIGMSESETKVYLALLKMGKGNVTQIAEESGVHRTNIYNILDKLKGMGLASHFKKDNRMYFKAADPENLMNYLKESEEAVQDLMPDLKKIQELVSEKVSVEVFQGEKGMKSAMKDIIREKEEVVGFGMTGQLRTYLPVFAKQWIRDIRRSRILNRYIYVKGTEFVDRNFRVRVLPEEFNTPVGTQIYKDKVLVTIWEPNMLAIMIRSKHVADNYRKHFELLWSIAKSI